MPNWWFAQAWEHSPAGAVSWVFWVIASITLHELGHGWAALRRGDPTPAESGHMTWNPIVHMGPTSLLIFALCGFAWGAMPVDPTRLKGRHADAAVAAAGPAMNLGLAAICLPLLAVWLAAAGGLWAPALRIDDAVLRNFEGFFFMGAAINIALLLLNLVPVPPLDGSRIVGSFVPSFARAWQSDGARALSLMALIGVLVFGGPRIMDAAIEATVTAREAILGLIAPGAA